jgi:hypothetical protein
VFTATQKERHPALRRRCTQKMRRGGCTQTLRQTVAAGETSFGSGGQVLETILFFICSEKKGYK